MIVDRLAEMPDCRSPIVFFWKDAAVGIPSETDDHALEEQLGVHSRKDLDVLLWLGFWKMIIPDVFQRLENQHRSNEWSAWH